MASSLASNLTQERRITEASNGLLCLSPCLCCTFCEGIFIPCKARLNMKTDRTTEYDILGRPMHIWRFHYFAHLDKTQAYRFGFVDAGQQIGTVGTTGNAIGKPAHLHYSIRSLYPQFWQYKPKTIAAWHRTFYVNPDKFLRS